MFKIDRRLLSCIISTAMTPPRSNDESISALLEYFAERLNLVFAYFYCALEFRNDDDFIGTPGRNDRTWALQTIQNACLHATLIALRDLDDFFRNQKSRPDDLRASDLGFPNALGFLTQSEREAINKSIAHSTLPGARAKTLRWDVFELTTKGINQALQFLDWAEKHFGNQFLTWSAALVCRRKTQAIYAYIKKAIDEEEANQPKSA